MCEPFLRWAGGKRWLAPDLARLYTRGKFDRYVEPFLGGGAALCAIAPSRALLSDANADLIATWRTVIRHGARIEERLQVLPVERSFYDDIRRSKPRSAVDRAVRFIYLNRTCYGGLHRTNRAGDFNVPFGGGSRTPDVVWKKHLLLGVQRTARAADWKFLTADFEVLLSQCGDGDFVYCDPTYHAVTRTTFDRYGPTIFDWNDQKRLAASASNARARGAVVVISNAFHTNVQDLFDDAYLFARKRSKSIGHRAKDHETALELVAVYDAKRRREWWQTLGVPARRSLAHARSAVSNARA